MLQETKWRELRRQGALSQGSIDKLMKSGHMGADEFKRWQNGTYKGALNKIKKSGGIAIKNGSDLGSAVISFGKNLAFIPKHPDKYRGNNKETDTKLLGLIRHPALGDRKQKIKPWQAAIIANHEANELVSHKKYGKKLNSLAKKKRSELYDKTVRDNGLAGIKDFTKKMRGRFDAAIAVQRAMRPYGHNPGVLNKEREDMNVIKAYGKKPSLGHLSNHGNVFRHGGEKKRYNVPARKEFKMAMKALRDM